MNTGQDGAIHMPERDAFQTANVAMRRRKRRVKCEARCGGDAVAQPSLEDWLRVVSESPGRQSCAAEEVERHRAMQLPHDRHRPLTRVVLVCRGTEEGEG